MADSKKNPSKPWNYERLSLNSSWDIVKENLSKIVYYNLVSANTRIDFKFIEENIDKPWDYLMLSINPMYSEKEKFIRRKLQEDFSRSELKRDLMEVMFSPKNIERWEQCGV